MLATGLARDVLSEAAARKRGACPTLFAPMPTGDGLLARFAPLPAPLAAAQLAGLAVAAATHGNGIVEITRRGSLQVRGLTPASAPAFAAAIAALGIDATAPLPIHVSPLAGLDPSEAADMRPLADELAAAAAGLRLAPKLSVVLDGGGRIGLAGIPADLRAVAETADRFYLYVAETPAGSFTRVGLVPAILDRLRRIAAVGPSARARDLSPQFFSELPPASDSSDSQIAATADPVGVYRLREGAIAIGVGLAFGHVRAEALAALARLPASGFAPAPGRVLLCIAAASDIPDFRAAATKLGFVVDAADPRRFVSACAGAPYCASAWAPARDVAGTVAATLAPWLAPGREVHVSGCGKGCAHPGPVALTLTGMDGGYGLVRNGRAGDPPATFVAAGDLPAVLAREAAHG